MPLALRERMPNRVQLACLNCQLECTADLKTPGCGAALLKMRRRRGFTDEQLKGDILAILRKIRELETSLPLLDPIEAGNPQHERGF